MGLLLQAESGFKNFHCLTVNTIICIYRLELFILLSMHGRIHVQTGWNISVWNVDSTTMSVRWSPYNFSKTQNPGNLYGFAVACIPVRSNSTPTISSADVSSLTQEVVGLQPFTEYRVRVIAILKDGSSGMVVMRTSETVLANTTEDGTFFPLHLLNRMELGLGASIMATTKKSITVQTALQILYKVCTARTRD